MIHFRCIRCQHAVDVSEQMIGNKIYCPVCYLELTVPAASTITTVDESQLYTADAAPVDVRTMEDRKKFVSLRCPVCSTNIAVTKDQIGTELVCPECETPIRVPESIAEKVDRALSDWARDNRTWDNRTPEERKQDGLMWNNQQTTKNQPNNTSKETYALHNGNTPVNNSSTIRVYCKLCGTMMYASDAQIGTELTCPDCETKTIVPARPKPIPVPPPLPLTFEGGTTFRLADSAPPSANSSLIPVVCSLCGTRMYANENEIGAFKTCPDCGRQTEIKSVPKSEHIQPVIVPNGGYGVSSSELPEKRPVFRTLTDYRYIDGSLDKELHKKLYDHPKPPAQPVLYDPYNQTTEANNLNTETLRERHATKQISIETNRNIIQIAQRTPLPPFPFLSRILVPFCDGGLLGRTITAISLCITGLLGGAFLPSILNLAPLFVVVSAPFGVVILMLGLSLLANTWYSLFLWTTNSNDLPNREDWQEYRLLESGSFAVWLFLLAILAVSPGYLLLSSISTVSEWTTNLSIESAIVSVLLLSGSFILFFPIFFLSSMEAGSYFVVLSRETCRSLINNLGIWLRFYFISFCLFVLFGFIIFLASLIISQILMGIALLIPIWSFCSLFYARFLGRLGWALEESAHQENHDS
ncbi:MAG: hypothetical protein LBI18_15960 [Planctomycetaceae bacterium]|nr:hypothetical protein [Planctomycetaceae bacterium]